MFDFDLLVAFAVLVAVIAAVVALGHDVEIVEQDLALAYA